MRITPLDFEMKQITNFIQIISARHLLRPFYKEYDTVGNRKVSLCPPFSTRALSLSL